MSQPLSFELANKQESNMESASSTTSDQFPCDSIKLLREAGKRETTQQNSKVCEQFGTPTLYNKSAADSTPASSGDKNITDKVIDRIKDSSDPVHDIKSALKKLDNLQDAAVTRNGQSDHIEINLKHGETTAPPNVQVRGFRPIASHIAPHLSFDLTQTSNGLMLSNMDGFSSTVRGPLGRLRHSETTNMYIGKDCYGPYVSTTSDLYMRRRAHTSTTILREQNLPADSPLRSAMQHPDALDKLGSMMRMFQNNDNLSKLGIKRNGDAFDVQSEAKSSNHIELNFKPDKLPIPVTVKSMDLDKSLSASISQSDNSVTLGKISGLKVNVDIAGVKASVCPTQVSIEKDAVKMQLKNPEDGSIIPLSIPVKRLKESAKNH